MKYEEKIAKILDHFKGAEVLNVYDLMAEYVARDAVSLIFMKACSVVEVANTYEERLAFIRKYLDDGDLDYLLCYFHKDCPEYHKVDYIVLCNLAGRLKPGKSVYEGNLGEMMAKSNQIVIFASNENRTYEEFVKLGYYNLYRVI